MQPESPDKEAVPVSSRITDIISNQLGDLDSYLAQKLRQYDDDDEDEDQDE